VCCSTCERTNLVVFLSLFSKLLSLLTGSLVFRTLVRYFITLFTLVLLRHLGGVIFDLDRNCIFNRSSDFCPRIAKWGVC
jgi:hypothetical protein